jgi:transcriptional regulator with XRE-family HTH domain
MNERLKFIRKSVGLNQEEMAGRLGVNNSTLRNYETGRSNPVKIVEKLTEIFNVNPTWFMTGSGLPFLTEQVMELREPELGYNKKVRLADQIKKARISAGITQADAAKLAGCNRVTYSRYESGASIPSDVFLPNLARALNTTVEWLLTGEQKEPKFIPINSSQILTLPMTSFSSISKIDLSPYFDDPSKYSGPTYSILPQPEFDYSKAVVISVEGSSMAPRYPSGSRVVAVPVPESHIQFIHGVHGIVLKSDIFFLKRVISNDGKTIVIRSDSVSSPDDRKIQISDIRIVWKVLHIAFSPAE